MRLDDTAHAEQFARESGLLELLRPLLAHKDFQMGAMEFLSGLAQALGCERASLGIIVGKTIKLCAVSHSPHKINASTLPEVMAAMEESILQDAMLAYPHLPCDFPYIVVAHGKLVHVNGLSSALTVPLGQEGRLMGAITFEKCQQAVFSPEQLSLIDHVAHHAGPLLKLKWSLEQPLAVRFLNAFRADEEGKSRRWTRIALGATVTLSALAAFTIPVLNQVSGQARLEASVQRMVSAPIDGYLKEVRVRPGDQVRAQQVLAELNDETLLTERRKLEAEALQQENSLAEAMAKADRTQVVIRRAKLDEVLAQKDLVSQQLERIQLVAPFDGVVIKGDLTQLLDSPLKRGDILLTLSQGSEFRVIVEVPEREVGDIKVGQRGTLVLTALPAEHFGIRIARITPVAVVSSGGQNVFEVEAALDRNAPKLVPGLKGVAKITTEKQPIGWKWMRNAWYALTFLVWSQLG